MRFTIHYLKRLLDILASATAIIICVPLFLLIPLFIWMEDGSPLFFRQERVGRDGKRFVLFKFRTMRSRAAQDDQDIYTREGDHRVTSVGRRLRKLRFDELPQLWNALKGDISLIGPRPEWSKCAAIRAHHPLLSFSAPGQTGDHRMGAGKLSLRRE